MFNQTTLLKFCNDLPEPNFPSLLRILERSKQIHSQTEYSYHMTVDNSIEIDETHCLTCGSRLYNNGFNFKNMKFDFGVGEISVKIHRKRCPNCGEIPICMDKLGEKYAHKHENLKRRSRQLYTNGLRYKQIVKIFNICYNITISKTQIYNWVKESKEKLRELLQTVKIPSSGIIGYDEVFLNICGVKFYLMTSLDPNTGFMPSALVVKTRESNVAKKMLTGVKKVMNTKLIGIVKDCSTIFGSLFFKRGWEHIQLQDCVTHVKWIITKRVKAFAGLSIQSIKPVPDEWLGLLGKFYRVINSRHMASAYCNLETLRYVIDRFRGERSKHLKIAFNFLESHIDNLLRWKTTYDLPKTNNKLEGYHKKFEYYPEFKRGMKTKSGAQFVADQIVFMNNLESFPIYIEELEEKLTELPNKLDHPNDKRIRATQMMQLRKDITKAQKSYDKYLEVWEKYFKILPN